MTSLINIGVSGLRAHQESLAVTGQNITNASTPGYARQRAEITSVVGSATATRFDGAGARVDNIKRMVDEQAIVQVRRDQSLHSQMDTLAQQLRQIESVFFGEASGIDQGITRFFDALQVANASPSSVPDRQIVLDEARALAERFHSVHARLDQQASTVDGLIHADLKRVNELAVGIADLNDRINSLQNNQRSGTVNGLLDKRDLLLNELAEFASITVVEESGGQVNVFLGKGKPVVLDVNASTFEMRSDGAITMRTVLQSTPENVTQALSGGELGGLVEFRDDVLRQVQNEVGVLAASVTENFNRVHAQGLDLKSNFGGAFFEDLNTPELTRGRVLANADNVPGHYVAIDVHIDDAAELSGSDYSLEFSESDPGVYIVRRQSDNRLVASGLVKGNEGQTLSFDGLTVTLGDNEFLPGDRYLLTPVRNAGRDFGVAIQDPSKLALAAPVRLTSMPDNVGGAAISIAGIHNTQHGFFSEPGELVPPLQVVFTSENTFDVMDASDPFNPQQLDPPLRSLPYIPGVTNELLPGDGAQIIYTSGSEVSKLTEPVVSATPTDLTNGYQAGFVDFEFRDVDTGALQESRSINFVADSSANEIARRLSALNGVRASAHTEVTLSEFTNNGIGEPLQLIINGESFDDVESLDDLADAISSNENLARKGIRARSDGERLVLTSVHGDDLDLHVSGDPTDGVTLSNAAGQDVRLYGPGGGNYRSTTVGGSVVVVMDEGVSATADAPGLFTSNPAHTPADFGFTISLQGTPEIGDRFELVYNSDATTDNRNGLALGNLPTQELLGEPKVTFNDAYASIVFDVGSKYGEAELQSEAAKALLDQSIEARESVQGVNLDEEAANLIRLEQAYNASAQVITVARDIFDILFSAVR